MMLCNCVIDYFNALCQLLYLSVADVQFWCSLALDNETFLSFKFLSSYKEKWSVI